MGLGVAQNARGPGMDGYGDTDRRAVDASEVAICVVEAHQVLNQRHRLN